MNYEELKKKLMSLVDDGQIPSGFQDPAQQEEGLREPTIDPIAVLTPVAMSGVGKLARQGSEMLTSPISRQILADETGSIGASIARAPEKAARELADTTMNKALQGGADMNAVKQTQQTLSREVSNSDRFAEQLKLAKKKALENFAKKPR